MKKKICERVVGKIDRPIGSSNNIQQRFHEISTRFAASIVDFGTRYTVNARSLIVPDTSEIDPACARDLVSFRGRDSIRICTFVEINVVSKLNSNRTLDTFI